jgi:hypothetical protein
VAQPDSHFMMELANESFFKSVLVTIQKGLARSNHLKNMINESTSKNRLKMNRSLVTTMIILILQFFFIFSCQNFTSKRQLTYGFISKWIFNASCFLLRSPSAPDFIHILANWGNQNGSFDHRRTG